MSKLIIKWTVPAFEDFMSYVHYYRNEAGIAISTKFADELENSLKILSEMPNISRPGRKISTREYVMQKFPFILEFRVIKNHLEILAFLHQKRKID